MKNNKCKAIPFSRQKQIGAFTIEYAYVISIVVIMMVGVSGVMKTPLVNFMDCAAEKIAEYIIGDSSAGCGSSKAVVTSAPTGKNDQAMQQQFVSKRQLLTNRRADKSADVNSNNSFSGKNDRLSKSSAILISKNQKSVGIECEQDDDSNNSADSLYGISTNNIEHCDTEEAK